MPDKITQVNRDVRSEVNATVGSLGKLKAGEVGVRTDVVAKNLFEKYPNTDRIIIAQMMAATYCLLVRDSKTIRDSEKVRLWAEFSERVFKFENPNYNPTPQQAPQPKRRATPGHERSPVPTSGSIINQNSPNYGEQVINNAPASRLLDAERAGKFRAALVGTRGTVWILIDGTDQDVLPLASQLCGLFKGERPAVNCIGVPGSSSFVTPPKLPTHLVGLHCYEVDAATQKAFNDAGLECIYEAGPLGEPAGLRLANAIAIGDAK